MSEEITKMTSNMAIRAAVDGVLEIMGDNGAKILFRNIGMENLYEAPPEYNLEPCITVPEQAKIYNEVVHLVGLNGAIGIWRRLGYTNIRYAHEIGHILDYFNDLPDPNERFEKGVEIFVAASGKGRIITKKSAPADFDCFDCLLCDGYHSDRPMCSVYAGVMTYIADWAYGKGKYIGTETSCIGKGDDTCYFTLMEK